METTIPNALIYVIFSLKTANAASTDTKIIATLLIPNTAALPICVFWSARIRKYIEPKFEEPRIKPNKSVFGIKIMRK